MTSWRPVLLLRHKIKDCRARESKPGSAPDASGGVIFLFAQRVGYRPGKLHQLPGSIKPPFLSVQLVQSSKETVQGSPSWSKLINRAKTMLHKFMILFHFNLREGRKKKERNCSWNASRGSWLWLCSIESNIFLLLFFSSPWNIVCFLSPRAMLYHRWPHPHPLLV